MISKSIKKIWLFCLCLASLSLVGCFHVPDEDWLPSRNKVKTKDMKKENEEVEQAINSLVDWFNMVSTQRNDIKNEDSEQFITEESNENIDWTGVDIDENEEISTNTVDTDTWNNITD